MEIQNQQSEEMPQSNYKIGKILIIVLSIVFLLCSCLATFAFTTFRTRLNTEIKRIEEDVKKIETEKKSIPSKSPIPSSTPPTQQNSVEA